VALNYRVNCLVHNSEREITDVSVCGCSVRGMSEIAFGEMLEYMLLLLWCLENCWNTCCCCCGVWRIAGIHVAVVMFGELLECNVSLL